MGKAIDELKSVVMSSGGTILRHETVTVKSDDED